MSTRIISVRLDETLVARLDDLAERLGISRTQAIEVFIDRGIRESERANDQVRSLKYKKFGLGPDT